VAADYKIPRGLAGWWLNSILQLARNDLIILNINIRNDSIMYSMISMCNNREGEAISWRKYLKAAQSMAAECALAA